MWNRHPFVLAAASLPALADAVLLRPWVTNEQHDSS
jgi:hypothetical protein